MRKKYFVFLYLFGFYSYNAQAAYFFVSTSELPLNYSKRTHVIVTSKGNDLGLTPQLSAATLAKNISKNFFHDQVVLFLPSSNDSQANKASLREMGFLNIQFVNKLLNPKELMDEVSRFSQIASFHFIGHSATTEGLFLDGLGARDIRWYPSDRLNKSLAGHFTADAFAALDGCNSGQMMASSLSKAWGIPVAGSLTSTHFETLYKDGKFYVADERERANWLDRTYGAVYRMRSDNSDYDGVYGKYQQGLPFYKFFCTGVDEQKCLLGMAMSTQARISSVKNSSQMSEQEYMDVVRELLCPVGSWGSKLQSRCINKLAGAVTASSSFSPYLGHSANCNFSTCYPSSLTCETAAKASDCARFANPPEIGTSTTFVDEYYLYLKAFPMLKVRLERQE